MKEIWLDTDIGDDIDDYLALESLLRREDVRIIGISTVFKNTPLRAAMVRYILSLVDQDIPVYEGSSFPLKGLTPQRPHEVFNQWGEELTSLIEERKDIGEIILDALKKHKDASLLAIGPLTNIGKAILIDKEDILKNHSLYFMGGEYQKERPEWNLECDVEAFSLVASSKMKTFAIGLEETEKTILNAKEEAILMTPFDALSEYRTKCIARFKKATNWTITPHDVLVVYALLNEDKVVFQPAKVEVKIEKERGNCRVFEEESSRFSYLKEFSLSSFKNFLLS